MIDSAERSEISCSPDRPPKITPTRILLTPQSPYIVLAMSIEARADSATAGQSCR
jgi:hypothetical protein